MAETFRLPARAIGTELPAQRQAITPRRAMAYAAGIGSERACYFSGPSGLVAPGLVASLEWPLVNGGAYRAALGASQEQMERAIHVRQTTLFRRPLKLGQVVETSGRIVAMRETRKGVLIATRLATRLLDGRLLTSSLFVTLSGGAELAGEARNLEALPAPVAVTTGGISELAAPFPVPVTLAHVYSECAAIWNPIHTELEAARRAGLEGPVLHGTCSFATIIERSIDAFCDGNPARIGYAAADFRGPVFPGTRLAVELSASAARPGRRNVDIRSGADVLVSSTVAARGRG